MTGAELKEFLDEKAELYNHPDFILEDPIQVPHQFELKEDIEIAAFFAATIAWGQRVTIINNANRLMKLMGNSPFDFVMSANKNQLNRLSSFKHRTFNGEDAIRFTNQLRRLYLEEGGMEQVFKNGIQSGDTTVYNALVHFKSKFLGMEKTRTHKHVSDPSTGSAAKRINMFLRWMCRKDNKGVDFGIWNISPSLLSCPLDLHTGNIGRMLGILTRKQNDWKAVMELDAHLRSMNSQDPVKYDFALFGLGAVEKFHLS